MEAKKISFGFKKTKKVDVMPVVRAGVEEKKEYIDCLEEKAIKVVGGEVIEEKTPLVIPMQPNTLITAERLQQIAEEVESAVQDLEPSDKSPEDSTTKLQPDNETIDQMAVRELLEEAKKEKKNDGSVLTVPLPQLALTGEKESTLDDYESIPVAEFGMAMLRGMGWTPNKEQNKYKQPTLRPKGLGLGADMVIKKKSKMNSSKEDEMELMIVKNGFVKITIGKYIGYYGKVLSLDEDNGRVMVDIPMKKETVSLSEFMMQAVKKTEFDQQSRVLNADKYEEYKKSQHSTHKKNATEQTTNKYNRDGPSRLRPLEDRSRHIEKRNEADKYDRNGSLRRRNRSSSIEDRSRKREERKKYSSNDSLDSLSNSQKRKYRNDREGRRRSNSKERSCRRKEKKYSSTDSLDTLSDRDSSIQKESRRNSDCVSDTSDSHKKRMSKKSKKHKKDSSLVEKRDIDKKRKGKKKKRDRDRSPNYKKHRK